MDALMVENLRNEYREITLCWRHIATFRFGILPFMIGFSGWVINLMTAGYVRADALIILAPVGGSLWVWLLLALDDRLVKLYDIFLQRGVDINLAHAAPLRFQRSKSNLVVCFEKSPNALRTKS